MFIQASDARSWRKCKRRVWFDNNPPADFVETEAGEFEQLIIENGNCLEKKYLEQFKQTLTVVEATSQEHTKALMKDGVDVIYQGIFIKENIIGKPDFLIRQSSGAYQPADVKLAHDADKIEIQTQLGVYRFLMETKLPALAYLATGEIMEIGDEANEKVSAYLASMQEILGAKTPPVARFSESKCRECPYQTICKPEFESKGELTLLYGLESRAAPGLEEQGYKDIKKLSVADPENIADVPFLKGHEKKQRIVLQAQSYMDGNFRQLSEITLPGGTWIHFDIEDYPLTESGQKHVYLWGFLKPNYDRADFDYIWTDAEASDRDGWEQFLAQVSEYGGQYPDLILAHFSHHEKTTIELYAKRYDMESHPVVTWLLGDESPLFDIQKPVKESLVLPIAGYGLKYICKHPNLVNFQWHEADSGSQWSIVQFARYLEEGAQGRARLKQSILDYNFDDVLATRKLELWLRALPNEFASIQAA